MSQEKFEDTKVDHHAGRHEPAALHGAKVSLERLPETTIQAASHIDPAAERRLVWKLDFTLFPLICVIYILNFIDRSNLGNARAAGLEADLGMRAYDFNLAASIFYIVYILSEFPSNMLVKRYGTALIPLAVIGFGLVTMCTAFVQNLGGFIAVRVFLGISEATTLPGCAYVLTRYYRRAELVWRVSMFLVIASLISGAFGGLLAAGFLNVAPIGSLQRWRAIFLCEGIITVGVGIASVFLFPSDIHTTKLFNETERELAVNRILADMPAATVTKEATKWSLLAKTINPMSMLCTLGFTLCNIVVQGIVVFLPSIVRGLGTFTPVEIQLKVVPVYIAALGWGTFTTYMALKTGVHTPWISSSLLFSVTGYSMLLTQTNLNVRYAATFLNLIGVSSAGPLFLSLACTNAAPDTIRAAMPALVTGIGAAGSVVGVWIYLPQEAATGYRTANIINLTAACAIVILGLVTLAYIRWENKCRHSGKRDHLLDLPQDEVEVLGWRHPAYRLSY